VSGRDEVRTFGASWGLEVFNKLSQIAIQHFGSKRQNLGDLVVDNTRGSDRDTNVTPVREKKTQMQHTKAVSMDFIFIFSRWLTLSPPMLEIHHQLQAVEALHVPLRLRREWCFPSLLGVRPSP
jgi:hypothetical protein